MKFGVGLKIVAVAMLLQGLSVLFGATAGLIKDLSTGIVSAVFWAGALEVGVSIGLLRSKWWALWGAIVFSLLAEFVILITLTNSIDIGKGEHNWIVFRAVCFVIVLWQAGSHIVRLKHQQRSGT